MGARRAQLERTRDRTQVLWIDASLAGRGLVFPSWAPSTMRAICAPGICIARTARADLGQYKASRDARCAQGPAPHSHTGADKPTWTSTAHAPIRPSPRPSASPTQSHWIKRAPRHVPTGHATEVATQLPCAVRREALGMLLAIPAEGRRGLRLPLVSPLQLEGDPRKAASSISAAAGGRRPKTEEERSHGARGSPRPRTEGDPARERRREPRQDTFGTRNKRNQPIFHVKLCRCSATNGALRLQ